VNTIKNTEAICLEDVMSNFDKEIDRDVEKQLKEGNCYAGYPAWNFHGTVYYKDDKFYCEIWTYGFPNELINAETLEEIIELASDKYGWD